MEFIYKKLCCYPYMCKLQSPSKYSPFDAIHVLRYFLQYSSQFWTYWFWCLLVLLLFFVSPLSHQQNNSLWGLFSLRETRKSHLGGNLWIRRKGYGGHAVLGPKLLNIQCNVGRCACKSPIMKWANVLKVFKKINWSQMQPLTITPAGTLMQMGSQNTHLAGEACLLGSHPPEDNSRFFWVRPRTFKHLDKDNW